MTTYIGAPALLASEKALREWIQENINLRLKDVPWDLDDDGTGAGSGSLCATAPNAQPRTLPLLANCKKRRRYLLRCCLLQAEARCFVTVVETEQGSGERAQRENRRDLGRVGRSRRETAPAATLRTPPTPKPSPTRRCIARGSGCRPSAVPAPRARRHHGARRGAGQKKFVCIDDKCKVHKHSLQRESSNGNGSAPYDHEEENFKRHREEQAAKDRIDELVVEKVLATAVAKIKKPDAKVLRTILVTRFSNWYGELDLVGRVLGLKFKSADDSNAAVKAFMNKTDLAGLTRLMFLVTLSEDLVVWSPELKTMAKEYGIDMAKVRKEIEKAQTPPKPAAPAKAKKAKAGK
jgi:hypothetical protein